MNCFFQDHRKRDSTFLNNICIVWCSAQTSSRAAVSYTGASLAPFSHHPLTPPCTPHLSHHNLAFRPELLILPLLKFTNMPSRTNMGSRRESWPPTQLRLVRSGSVKSNEPRPLLEDIDEDPLTYFLTPNADDQDQQRFSDSDDPDDVLDFDAGIEVAGRPKDLVRSVSPSTLDGLRKGLGSGGGLRLRRAASPDFDSDGLTSEDDDDGEDYIRFFPSSPSSPPASPPPFRTRSPGSLLSAMPRHSFAGFRSRDPVLGGFASFPASSSFPAPAPSSAAAAARGRATLASRRGRSFATGAASARLSRPGHLWRQPSADVWSIEEETEEELMMSETRGRTGAVATTTASQRAKPIKKVRFVLPDEE